MTTDDTAADEVDAERAAARSARLRWGVLALLVGVLVAGLTVSALVVFGNGAGSGVGDKVSSVFDPPRDPSKDRERVLAAARTFVQRFNTYGPDLLESDGTMPKYAEVGDLMTAKFRRVFSDNLQIPEKTVAETGIDRIGEVYGIGVAAIDQDSATVLVGSTVTSSYPSKDDPGQRIDFAPQRFRYEVTLVKIGGQWLVDDLDDVDDGLPSLANSSSQGDVPGQGSSGAPSGSPSGAPSSDAPSSTATPSGDAS